VRLRELWQRLTRRSDGDESSEAGAKRESRPIGKAGAAEPQIPMHPPTGQDKPKY
jgi:hypothetical protein